MIYPIEVFILCFNPFPIQNVCLENILHGFTKPCILDLKMGGLLYDEDASEEKRERMINHSITTTSGLLGLRICGMKVNIIAAINLCLLIYLDVDVRFGREEIWVLW